MILTITITTVLPAEAAIRLVRTRMFVQALCKPKLAPLREGKMVWALVINTMSSAVIATLSLPLAITTHSGTDQHRRHPLGWPLLAFRMWPFSSGPGPLISQPLISAITTILIIGMSMRAPVPITASMGAPVEVAPLRFQQAMRLWLRLRPIRLWRHSSGRRRHISSISISRVSIRR